MDHRISFQELILPWLGEDTWILYAPVCREWAAAYGGATVTHPRHVLASLALFKRYRRYFNLNDPAATSEKEALYIARYGAIDVLRACKISDKRLAREAAEYGNAPAVLHFGSPLSTEDAVLAGLAAKGGHLSVLRLFDIMAFDEIDIEVIFYELGRMGDKSILEEMRDRYPDDLKPCAEMSFAQGAAYKNHLHVLEWLGHKNFSIVNAAAHGGHLELVQLLVARGYPLRAESACRCAIMGASVEVADWLMQTREINVSPSWWEAVILACMDPIRSFEWLAAHRTPFAANTMIHARNAPNPTARRKLIIQWLINAGCPDPAL